MQSQYEMIKMKKGKKEELFKNVAKNIKTIIENSGVKQKELAEEFGVAHQTVNNYCNNKQVPTLEFLYKLKCKFNISIDDLLENQIPLLTEQDLENDIQKYIGSYVGYYVDNISENEKRLNRAVLVLDKMNVATSTRLSVKACFSLSENEAETIYEKARRNETSFWNEKDIKSKTYSGEVEFTRNYIYLYMTHTSRDRLLAIFYRVDPNKGNYRGGLGTMNSVSRGRDEMPTIQYFGISRDIIQRSDEEILRELMFMRKDIRKRDVVKALYDSFLELYKNEDVDAHLKSRVFQFQIESVINTEVENEICYYSKIPKEIDGKWYHFLKEKNEDC